MKLNVFIGDISVPCVVFIQIGL